MRKVVVVTPRILVPSTQVIVDVEDATDLYKKARTLVKEMADKMLKTLEESVIKIREGNKIRKACVLVSVHPFNVTISSDFLSDFKSKAVDIPFGGTLHKRLWDLSISQTWKTTEEVKLKLANMELVRREVITAKGKQVLDELAKQGPKVKGESRELRMAWYMLKEEFGAYLYNKGFPPSIYTDWLAAGGLMEYVQNRPHSTIVNGKEIWQSAAYTEKGKQWVAEREEELFTKVSNWGWCAKANIISCLPLERLPKYLSSEDPNVRRAAQKRYEEITGSKPQLPEADWDYNF